MRRTIVGAILLCLSLNASAADDSVFGTHWAKFQPIQVEGDVQGCQLTFLTVTADRVYLDGNQVAVNGSIRIGDRPRFLRFPAAQRTTVVGWAKAARPCPRETGPEPAG